MKHYVLQNQPKPTQIWFATDISIL